MTYVFLQYPPVYILFAAAALLTLTAAGLSRRPFLPALLGGLSAVAMLLWGLYCSVPLTELLAMLLTLVLLCATALRKGGRT